MKTEIPVLKTVEERGIKELSLDEIGRITAGSGPIREALEWYYMTMGSFYRGLWDGLTGQEPKA